MEKGLEIHASLISKPMSGNDSVLSLHLATSLEIPHTNSKKKKKLNILSCGVQEIW